MAQESIVMVPTEKLKPHPMNEKIYQPREDQDFEESIKTHGIIQPLIITPNYVIISGVRRWKAARNLGIPHVPCIMKTFDDEVVALIEYNRYRIKTPREIYQETKILRKRLEPKARERMLRGVKSPESNLTQGRVRDQIAKITGVSSGQLYYIEKVYDHEDVIPDVIEKLDRGEITVHKAFTELRKRVMQKPAEEEKKWRCSSCMKYYGKDVQPVTFTLCPECALEFESWKMEREAESNEQDV